MNSLKLLIVFLALASSAFAQVEGLSFSAGGGWARMTTSRFDQTTSYGETLTSTNTGHSVRFADLGVGYQLNDFLGLELSYTDFGTSEVQLSLPKYPNIASILPMPSYSRNVLKYDTTRFSLGPSFTATFSDKLRMSVKWVLTYNQTYSHFESTYTPTLSGPSSETVNISLPREKYTDWNQFFALGFDYALTQHLSIRVSGRYAKLRIKVPVAYVAGVGSGATRPSRDEAKVDSFESDFSLVWRL